MIIMTMTMIMMIIKIMTINMMIIMIKTISMTIIMMILILTMLLKTIDEKDIAWALLLPDHLALEVIIMAMYHLPSALLPPLNLTLLPPPKEHFCPP